MNIYCTNDHEGKIVNAITTISCHDVGVCAHPTLVDARDGLGKRDLIGCEMESKYAVAASLNQGGDRSGLSRQNSFYRLLLMRQRPMKGDLPPQQVLHASQTSATRPFMTLSSVNM